MPARTPDKGAATKPPRNPNAWSRYETERLERHATSQATSNGKRIDEGKPKREDVGRALLLVLKELQRTNPGAAGVLNLRKSVVSTLVAVGFNLDQAARVLDDFLENEGDALAYWKASRRQALEVRARKKEKSGSAADKK